MIKWNSASKNDVKRLTAIKILFDGQPNLINFIFHPLKPKLAKTHEKLKEEMLSFSSGEQTLILVAMDIWGTYGGIHFDDLYTRLSPRAFNNCMKALALMTGYKLKK